LDLPGELIEHLGAGHRIIGDDVSGESQIHGERNQMLLRAVVEVPFDPSTLGVATGHNAGTGFA
jgi:hypothetical protein